MATHSVDDRSIGEEMTLRQVPVSSLLETGGLGAEDNQLFFSVRTVSSLSPGVCRPSPRVDHLMCHGCLLSTLLRGRPRPMLVHPRIGPSLPALRPALPGGTGPATRSGYESKITSPTSLGPTPT